MIELVKGNLLEADVEALVNPVNTHGVMGKGLALLFKEAYPDMVAAYERECNEGKLTIGKMQVYDRHTLVKPRYIINFPTKRHWREHSKLEYITRGLEDLVSVVRRLEIQSIAVPALGCGYGGLAWHQVYPHIYESLGGIEDLQVLLFVPHDAEELPTSVQTQPQLRMTFSRASVIQVLSKYIDFGNELTLLEVHKLLYFLQEAGEPLRLRFSADYYGPYADNLQYVLRTFEGHYTSGFGQGGSKPDLPILLIPGATDEALRFLSARKGLEESATRQRLERVFDLIEGFESPYGLELLSTVHYVVVHKNVPSSDLQVVAHSVHNWNERKRKLLRFEHIEIAWHRLEEQGWFTRDQRSKSLQHSGDSSSITAE